MRFPLPIQYERWGHGASIEDEISLFNVRLLSSMASSMAPSSMASSFFYRLLQRTLLFDVSHLLLASTDIPFDSGKFTFRMLTSDDIVRYGEDSATDLDARMASRVDSGIDYCFGAFDQSELAGYCWVARQNIEPKHNQADHPKTGTALSFGKDTGYVYKAFTRPEWRGQKVFPRVLGFASCELNRLGIRRLISTTDWMNHSAIRAFERSGFEIVGKVWSFARLSSARLVSAKAASLGIQFGSAAKFTPREEQAETAVHATGEDRSSRRKDDVILEFHSSLLCKTTLCRLSGG